jgi:tetratricopeptide (TPR) repeat protein
MPMKYPSINRRRFFLSAPLILFLVAGAVWAGWFFRHGDTEGERTDEKGPSAITSGVGASLCSDGEYLAYGALNLTPETIVRGGEGKFFFENLEGVLTALPKVVSRLSKRTYTKDEVPVLMACTIALEQQARLFGSLSYLGPFLQMEEYTHAARFFEAKGLDAPPLFYYFRGKCALELYRAAPARDDLKRFLSTGNEARHQPYRELAAKALETAEAMSQVGNYPFKMLFYPAGKRRQLPLTELSERLNITQHGPEVDVMDFPRAWLEFCGQEGRQWWKPLDSLHVPPGGAPTESITFEGFDFSLYRYLEVVCYELAAQCYQNGLDAMDAADPCRATVNRRLDYMRALVDADKPWPTPGGGGLWETIFAIEQSWYRQEEKKHPDNAELKLDEFIQFIRDTILASNENDIGLIAAQRAAQRAMTLKALQLRDAGRLEEAHKELDDFLRLTRRSLYFEHFDFGLIFLFLSIRISYDKLYTQEVQTFEKYMSLFNRLSPIVPPVWQARESYEIYTLRRIKNIEQSPKGR